MTSYDTVHGSSTEDGVYSPLTLGTMKCAREVFDLAMMLGDWEEAEVDGKEMKVVQFEGATFFLKKDQPYRLAPVQAHQGRPKFHRDPFEHDTTPWEF